MALYGAKYMCKYSGVVSCIAQVASSHKKTRWAVFAGLPMLFWHILSYLTIVCVGFNCTIVASVVAPYIAVHRKSETGLRHS